MNRNNQRLRKTRFVLSVFAGTLVRDNRTAELARVRQIELLGLVLPVPERVLGRHEGCPACTGGPQAPHAGSVDGDTLGWSWSPDTHACIVPPVLCMLPGVLGTFIWGKALGAAARNGEPSGELWGCRGSMGRTLRGPWAPCSPQH